MSEIAPIEGELVDRRARRACAGAAHPVRHDRPEGGARAHGRARRRRSSTSSGARSSPTIGGHEHLTAEAWTTLGGMLGVVPVVVWTQPNETGDGYLARVEARTLDGRVVGAAESECSRAERTWEKRDAYALRSMAQTRAIGSALRGPLGQIVVLAGYEPAGAEEMPAEPDRRREPDPAGAAAVEAHRRAVGRGSRAGAHPRADRPGHRLEGVVPPDRRRARRRS